MKVEELAKQRINESRWLYNPADECFVCPACDNPALNDWRGQSCDSNYCPTCGAEMRPRGCQIGW